MPNKNGMNWIRQTTRARLNERDGWSCSCCGRPVYMSRLVANMKAEPAANAQPATLDHIKPRVKGGGHEHSNLVTVCLSCNSQRQDQPMAAFLRRLEADGVIDSAAEAGRRISRRRRRALPTIDTVLGWV